MSTKSKPAPGIINKQRSRVDMIAERAIRRVGRMDHDDTSLAEALAAPWTHGPKEGYDSNGRKVTGRLAAAKPSRPARVLAASRLVLAQPLAAMSRKRQGPLAQDLKEAAQPPLADLPPIKPVIPTPRVRHTEAIDYPDAAAAEIARRISEEPAAPPTKRRQTSPEVGGEGVKDKREALGVIDFEREMERLIAEARIESAKDADMLAAIRYVEATPWEPLRRQGLGAPGVFAALLMEYASAATRATAGQAS